MFMGRARIEGKSKFNLTRHKDLLYGVEPELSVGLTRVIGKCD